MTHPIPDHGEAPSDTLELMSARDRIAHALDGQDQQAVSSRLEAVVATVTDRLRRALDEDAQRWADLATTISTKAERAWQPLAHEGIAAIEQAGAMVPGLSHQELYLRELRDACQQARTMEEFRTAIGELRSTWGSVLKYPLFGASRRRELKALLERVEAAFPAARDKAGHAVRASADAWRQEVHEGSRERLRSAMLDFGALLSSCFEVDLAAEEMIRMRWLLISIMTRRLFTWLMDAVRAEDSRGQDHIYFVVECLMGQVYDSFKVFIVAYRRRVAEIGALDAVTGFVDLEIGSVQKVTAQFERQVRAQPLTPALAGRIRDLLRSQAFAGLDSTDAFVAISAGLRGDTRFGDFLSHLKQIPGIEEHIADQAAVAIKTTIEPLRSLTYVAVMLVRYLKGLQNFKPR
jgi:hypothetical protein